MEFQQVVGSKPAEWTNIVAGKNNEFYFVNSNNKLCRIEVLNNRFRIIDLNSEIVKRNTKIAYNLLTNQVFFVRDYDSKLSSFWTINGQTGSNVLDEKSISAAVNSDIYVSKDGSSVFFIGTDRRFYVVYHNYFRWISYVLSKDTYSDLFTNTFCLQNDSSIYFLSDLKWFSELRKPKFKKDFVYKKGTELYMNNFRFNAKIANYCSYIYRKNGRLFLGPHIHYTNDLNLLPCTNDVDCNKLLFNDLKAISMAGFNAIRINDISVHCDTNNKHEISFSPDIYIRVFDFDAVDQEGRFNTMIKVDNAVYVELKNIITNLLYLCEETNLKLNLYTGLIDGQFKYNKICYPNYSDYLVKLGTDFSENSNIMMYSILLEPDHGAWDKLMNKQEICEVLNPLINSFKAVNRNHLLSYGLMDYYALRTFDPMILPDMDVITMHIYPDLRKVFNEFVVEDENFLRFLYWSSDILNLVVRKPWIIGEAGVPAVSDILGTMSDSLYWNHPVFKLVVDYSTQREYGLFSLEQTFLAGASEYGWWQYRDTYNKDLGRFFGLTDTSGLNKDILSPSVFINSVINGFNSSIKPNNYYNTNNSFPHSINGYVKDSNGLFLQNVLVYSIGENRFYFTFTDEKGCFNLKSNAPVESIEFAYPGMKNQIVSNFSNNAIVTLSKFFCSNDFESETEYNKSAAAPNICNLRNNPNVTIIPNPVKDICRIEIKGCDQFELFDAVLVTLNGEIINRFSFYSFEGYNLDINDLSSGIYLLKIHNSGLFEVIKIVKI